MRVEIIWYEKAYGETLWTKRTGLVWSREQSPAPAEIKGSWVRVSSGAEAGCVLGQDTLFTLLNSLIKSEMLHNLGLKRIYISDALNSYKNCFYQIDN